MSRALITPILFSKPPAPNTPRSSARSRNSMPRVSPC
jgi:hypothetical protein